MGRQEKTEAREKVYRYIISKGLALQDADPNYSPQY